MTELAHAALMVAYLMESGWRLHLNSDREVAPRILKTAGDVSVVKADLLVISHDVVLDLQLAGLLERESECQSENHKVTVFRYRKSGEAEP